MLRLTSDDGSLRYISLHTFSLHTMEDELSRDQRRNDGPNRSHTLREVQPGGSILLMSTVLDIGIGRSLQRRDASAHHIHTEHHQAITPVGLLHGHVQRALRDNEVAKTKESQPGDERDPVSTEANERTREEKRGRDVRNVVSHGHEGGLGTLEIHLRANLRVHGVEEAVGETPVTMCLSVKALTQRNADEWRECTAHI